MHLTMFQRHGQHTRRRNRNNMIQKVRPNSLESSTGGIVYLHSFIVIATIIVCNGSTGQDVAWTDWLALPSDPTPGPLFSAQFPMVHRVGFLISKPHLTCVLLLEDQNKPTSTAVRYVRRGGTIGRFHRVYRIQQRRTAGRDNPEP